MNVGVLFAYLLAFLKMGKDGESSYKKLVPRKALNCPLVLAQLDTFLEANKDININFKGDGVIYLVSGKITG